MDFATKVLCATGKTYLFYLGQAGYLIKSKNNQLLGVDLYLSDCVECVEGNIGFKRLLPKILNPDDVIVDYLIATHPHMDHFDMDSIPELVANKGTRLFVSKNCNQLINCLNLEQNKICYVQSGDTVHAGDFLLEFVECDHGQAAPDAVGVVITVDGKKIYMAGDTCLRLDRVSEMKQKGPYDIIIGPINGAYGNMNESEFAEYSIAIGAETIIPCHYGMFASHGGNPGKFLEKMIELNAIKSTYIMSVGEMSEI